MVSSTPRPYFTPVKDTVPIVQEAGWAPGPVWTGGNSRLKGIAALHVRCLTVDCCCSTLVFSVN